MKAGSAIIPPAVVAALPKLSGPAAKLAVALGRYADRTGRCWPSTRTLMRVAGINDWRTFRAARESLRAHGLTWESGKGRRSCQYRWADVVPVSDTGNTDLVVTGATTGTKPKEKSVVPVIHARVVPVRDTVLTPHRTPHTTTAAINYDPGGVKFTGVTQTDLNRWAKTYPTLNIRHEMAAAAEWLLANPKNHKTNYRRFITNWLKRGQDRNKQSADAEQSQLSKIFMPRNPTREDLLVAEGLIP